MKRTYAFVEPCGVVRTTIRGAQVDLPVFVGVLKHPTEDQLRQLLADPRVALKYTQEALRRLPWPALRRFPHDVLRACLADSALPEARRRAVEFMLSAT